VFTHFPKASPRRPGGGIICRRLGPTLWARFHASALQHLLSRPGNVARTVDISGPTWCRQTPSTRQSGVRHLCGREWSAQRPPGDHPRHFGSYSQHPADDPRSDHDSANDTPAIAAVSETTSSTTARSYDRPAQSLHPQRPPTSVDHQQWNDHGDGCRQRRVDPTAFRHLSHRRIIAAPAPTDPYRGRCSRQP